MQNTTCPKLCFNWPGRAGRQVAGPPFLPVGPEPNVTFRSILSPIFHFLAEVFETNGRLASKETD